MASSSPSLSVRPIPAPRSNRGQLRVAAKPAEGRVPTTKALDLGNKAGERRPFMWTQEEFNLTALISSVESDIKRLEQLETGNGNGSGTANPDAARDSAHLGSMLMSTEELLALPGYKPKSLRMIEKHRVGQHIQQRAQSNKPEAGEGFEILFSFSYFFDKSCVGFG